MIYSVLKYINYLIHGKSKYRIHSPFLFDLVMNVLNDKREFYAFREIEEIRSLLLNNKETIDITDYGAGSRNSKSSARTIGRITRNSSINPKYGRLLFRLVNHYEPKNILELGTNMGLAGMYLCAPSSDISLKTIEGDPMIAAIARHNLMAFPESHGRVEIIEGTFEEKLDEVLRSMDKVDMAYIDGNHRYEPTVSYFNKIVSRCHEHSFIVVDDIYWSREMTAAWKEISSHPEVSVAIDLYRLGILFFRRENLVQEYHMLYY